MTASTQDQIPRIPFTFRGDDPRPWASIPVGPAAGIPGAEPHMLRDLARRMENSIRAFHDPRWKVIDPAFAPLVRALAAQVHRPCDGDFLQEVMWACAGLISPGGMENPRLGGGMDRYEPQRGIRVRAYGNEKDLVQWVAAHPARLYLAQEVSDVRTPYPDLWALLRQAQTEEIRQIAFWLRAAFTERLREVPRADRSLLAGSWEIDVPDYCSFLPEIRALLDGALPVDLPVATGIDCERPDHVLTVLYNGDTDRWIVADTHLDWSDTWYRHGSLVMVARWMPAPEDA